MSAKSRAIKKDSHAVVIINGQSVCVPSEVADEINRLRTAVRTARRFLQDRDETDPPKHSPYL